MDFQQSCGNPTVQGNEFKNKNKRDNARMYVFENKNKRDKAGMHVCI